MDDETISIDEARQAIDDMSRRVALLHLSYALALVEELGEERGRALIRRAIWDYGTRIGQRIKTRVEAMGLEPTIDNFDKGSDLSPVGFPSQAVAVKGEPRTRSFRCALAEVWKEYGEEALGSLYCLVDPAKVQGYDPHWTMVHTSRISKGCDYCEFAIRPVSEESKPD